jgi:dTDP-4-dehydrorhamnose reductase
VDVTNKEAATAAAEGGRGLVRMMRIAVTGSMGQVATSLIEQAGRAFEIVLLGRRVFLLEDHGAVLAGLKAARPDVVINAAAYTAVDQAEAEESLAVAINGEGAGHVAETADRIGAPLLQLSTDYVFDGALNRPYREDDPPGQRSAYGRAGRRALRQQRHRVHRLAPQPVRREFRPRDAFT